MQDAEGKTHDGLLHDLDWPYIGVKLVPVVLNRSESRGQ